jgi:2-polyprenyl-3-methyl-5-hydroxy-6-metoxy-1,4-benzoquinol methylase
MFTYGSLTDRGLFLQSLVIYSRSKELKHCGPLGSDCQPGNDGHCMAQVSQERVWQEDSEESKVADHRHRGCIQVGRGDFLGLVFRQFSGEEAAARTVLRLTCPSVAEDVYLLEVEWKFEVSRAVVFLTRPKKPFSYHPITSSNPRWRAARNFIKRFEFNGTEKMSKAYSRKENEYFSSDRKDMLTFVPVNVKTSLEFGCGTGNFSRLLKEEYGTETWAVEIDNQAAEKASKVLDNVICEDATASLGRLPAGYFDCVILFDVLEHLEDPYSFIKELKDKLSPDGVVVASIPNIRYFSAFRRYVFHGEWDYTDSGIMDKTHLRFFTLSSIKKFFTEQGYDIKKLRPLHPSGSNTLKILNLLTLGRFRDCKYKHFAVVAGPV